jgi:amino acid permease
MRFGSFLAIALLLFIIWIGGFAMFHVASALIHLLLLFAVISLVIHFVHRREGLAVQRRSER